MRYFVLLIAVLFFMACAVSAQDISAIKNNVSIHAQSGEVTFHPAGKDPVIVETKINGAKFAAVESSSQNDKVKYATEEKVLFVIPDPIVQQEYQVFDNGSIEETLYLKQKTDVEWDINLAQGSHLEALPDGGYKIAVPSDTGFTDGYTKISAPSGTDANGVRISYSYELGKDGHTLSLVEPKKNDKGTDIVYPVIVDPVITYQYTIVMLLHGNLEPSGGLSTTDFRDSSRYFANGFINSTAATGQVSINSSFFQYGNASMFSKNISSNITFPDNDRYTFGTNNFSVSGWVYYPTGAAIQSILWQHISDVAGTNNDQLNIASATVINFARVRSGAPIGSCSATLTSPIVVNKWYQVAFIQNGTTGQLYLNGTAVGAACTRTAAMTDIAAPININQITSASSYAHEDEVMVVNGGDAPAINNLFTGSEYNLYLNGTPNTGYADDNYTVSLLHFDGSNGGTFFRDQVGNRTWTPLNSATTATYQAKFGSTGGDFAGVAPNITMINTTANSNVDFDFGTGDFTIDGWFNASAPAGGYAGLFSAQNSVITGYSFFLLDPGILGSASNASGTYQIDLQTPSGTVPYGKYNHIAFIRNDSLFSIYVNGTLASQIGINNTWRFNTYGNLVKVGQLRNGADTLYYNGGIDELRVSKGIARWTTNFTPPTYAYEMIQPSFTENRTAISGPGTVQFNDTTPDSVWTNNTYLWTFGDGGYSSLQNPTHAFTSTGNFLVTENVYNNNMTASATYTMPVGAPVVDFMGAPTTGTAALLVTFTDLTTNATPITSYLIDFGDGATSTAPPPWTHVYGNFGAFSVNLTETNSIGTGFNFKRDYIVTSTPQGQNTIIYPTKDVRFHIQTIWGQALPGVSVQAHTSQTTLGNYSYVASLYGYQFANVPLNTLTLNGTTDTRGDITFAMMADTQYAMTYTLAGYTFPTGTTITPHDDNYIIYANSAGNTFTENGTAPQASVNYSVMSNRTNLTSARVFVNFTDVAGSTTSGIVLLYKTNTTFGNNSPPVILANESFTGNFTAKNYTLFDGTTLDCPASNSTVYNASGTAIGCFNVTLVNGQSCIGKTIAYTPNGNIAVQDPVWFKNIYSPIAGLSAEFALFMALGIMMFTAMMATLTTGPPISLAVTFEGWIFYGSNMLNLIDNVAEVGGVEVSSVVTVLTLMTFISIIYLFVTYRRSNK